MVVTYHIHQDSTELETAADTLYYRENDKYRSAGYLWMSFVATKGGMLEKQVMLLASILPDVRRRKIIDG